MVGSKHDPDTQRDVGRITREWVLIIQLSKKFNTMRHYIMLWKK